MAMNILPPDPLGRSTRPMNFAQLLRCMGAHRNLVAFRYVVYMAEEIVRDPDRLLLITKSLYRDTAKRFGTSPAAVERSVRTLIQICWKQKDHTYLDALAGGHMTERPSNARFLDLLSDYCNDGGQNMAGFDTNTGPDGG